MNDEHAPGNNENRDGPQPSQQSHEDRHEGGTLSPEGIDEISRRDSLSDLQKSEKPVVAGYEFLELIGTGSFGEVWSAIQTRTGQKVAVKMLRRQSFGDFAYLEREVSRMAKVTEHPNVVTLLDANLTHEVPFVVTPLLSGSLEAGAAQKTYSPEKLTQLFEQVTRALQYIHGKGILHCDLKPANILIDDEGAARVVDFGQAHLIGQEGLSLGTLWYMAPEQVAVSESEASRPLPDVSWDIYALGATLYELLTGTLPRMNESAKQAISRESSTLRRLERYREVLYSSTLVPVRKLNPQVDASLALIVEHCLELEPEKRYRSAVDVLEDLQRRREKYPLSAHPRRWWYELSWFLVRNARTVAVSLIALTIVVLSLVYSFYHTNAAKNDALARLADMEFERGMSLAEKGDSSGPVWIARSLYDLSAAQKNWQKYPLPEYRFALNILLRERQGVTCAAAHKHRINTASFSPQGARIVTASGDCTAQAWDAKTGRRLTPPLVHNGPVNSAIFNPEGSRIVTASEDCTARVWDAHTGKPMTKPLGESATMLYAEFSPDGKRIVTASDSGSRVWDSGTGEPVASLNDPDTGVIKARFSPDSRRIVTSSGSGYIKVWDTHTGKCLASSERLIYPPSEVYFSRDGLKLISLLPDEGITIRDASTGKRTGFQKTDCDYLFPSSFTADGRLIFIDKENRVQLLDITDGRAIPLAAGKIYANDMVFFSPDYRSIVTKSGENVLQLWDIRTCTHAASLMRHMAPIHAASFNADGSLLSVVMRDNTLVIWDIPALRTSWSPLAAELEKERNTTCAAFSPDNTMIVIAGMDSARVWEIESGKPLSSKMSQGFPITSVRFSPDGSTILTMCEEQVRVWDAATARLLTPGEPGLHRSASFSPDGQRLASVVSDCRVTVLDTATWKPAAPEISHGQSISSVIFSPDGQQPRIAITSQDNTARIWDADTAKPVTPPMLHSGPVTSAVFSPDGKYLATLTGDNLARLWNTSTGKPVQVRDISTGGLNDFIMQHRGMITSVVFSTDGHRLATSSMDRTSRIWEMKTGRPAIPPLVHAEAVYTARFSPDGRLLTTAAADPVALHVWDTREGKSLVTPMQYPDSTIDSFFSSDGKHLFTLYANGSGRLWHLEGTEDENAAELERQTGRITGLYLNPEETVEPR